MARCRRYPTKTKTDSDYADDPTLLANSPSQAESLLHSLEQAVEEIDLLMNANKTEFMSFKLEGTISTLSCKPIKLVDQFK